MLRAASVRSQLLALFGLAVLPAVVLSAGLSWHGYRAIRHATEAYQVQAATSIATQVLNTVTGANLVGYTLLSTRGDAGPEQFCATLREHVSHDTRISAYGYYRDGELVCAAGDAEAVRAFSYDDLTRAAQPRATNDINPEPHLAAVAASAQAPRRLGAAAFRGSSDVLLTVMSPAFLDRLVRQATQKRSAHFALVTAGQDVIAGDPESDEAPWLPKDRTTFEQARERLASGDARNGHEHSYVAAAIEPGGAYVLSGVREVRFGNAEQQLAIGLAVPLLIFAIVMAVAWLAIDRLFLQWMRRLARTANRLSFGDFNVRAALPANAPLELRQYADAFDQMTEVLAARTRELAMVANQRSALLRELHHRVKNNFQVIASFLNLTKRQKSGEAYEALALSECRVHAMATAYKLALADGDISNAALGPLVTEVLAYVQQAAGVSPSAIERRLPENDGAGCYLELDRAIPMSLLLVEVIWPLLEEAGGAIPRARLDFHRRGDLVSLIIRDMNPPQANRPGLAQAQRMSSRLQQAFISQLGAVDRADAEARADSARKDDGKGRVVLAITIPVLNSRLVT